jgi:ribonuclease HI
VKERVQGRDQVLMYVDGSCRGNPGPGGYAAVLRYRGHEKVIVGGSDDTTNSRMELRAVVEGLGAIKVSSTILVVTDSQYVKNIMEGGGAYVNQDLVMELRGRMAGHRIRVKKVKGHSGHEMNDRADELATAESARRANEESGRN